MRLQFLLLSTLLATAVTQSTYPKCGGSWEQLNDRCFLAVSGKQLNWKKARLDCQSRGGDLVIIPDQATADVLLEMLTGVTLEFWIGLQDKVIENAFTWVDDETVADKSYENWNPGEPNSVGNEDCVVFKPDVATGKWNDVGCLSVFPYICDRDVTKHLKCDESAGWRSYNGKCYQYVANGKRAFNSGDTTCSHFPGGHLMYVKSADDQAFVDNLQLTHGTKYWIGLQDKDGGNDGDYQWSDKSSFSTTTSYQKWDTDQPKNQWYGTDGDCGGVTSTGLWTINNCKTKLDFVCEIDEGTCPVGWKMFNGKCYQVNSQVLKTWTDAKKFCSAQGAYMTSITSDAENNYIKTYLQDLNKIGIDEVYIGISDVNHDGKYTWAVDDKPSGYKHWATGQPPGTNSQEDCGYILTANSQAAEWMAGDCFMLAAYVCEISKDTDIIVIPPDKVTDHCEDSYYDLFNSKCYRIVTATKESWADADKACENDQAELVSIHDDDVQSFMSGRINAVKQRVWMGLNKGPDGSFAWTDGSKFDYNSWAPGYPNSQDCVSMVGGATNYGQWKTRSCLEKNYYSCHKDAIAGVGPTSAPTQPPVYYDRCGNGWEYDKAADRCFHFHPTEYVNWFDARYKCRQEGGDLLSFTSNEDLAYASSRLQVIAWSGISWIGCNDLGSEGGWVWSDSEPFSFINWNPGEPNNVVGDNPSGEHCCQIYNNAGTWNDDYCYKDYYGFSCNRDAFIFKYFIAFTEKKLQDAVDLTLTDLWPQECAARCVSESSFSCQSFDYERDARTCYLRSINKDSGGGLLPTFDTQHFDHYERDKSVPAPVPPTPPPSNMGCPENWTPYRSDCFYSSFLKDNYAGVRKDCQNRKGDLASIKDMNVNNFVRGMIYAQKQTETRFWIGLNDASQEMLFEWADGEDVTFTNWNTNEPNNVDGEDCTEMYIDTGFWNDLPCTSYYMNALCRQPMSIGQPKPPVDVSCPTGWIPWFDRCFLLSSSKANWKDASTNCKKTAGAQLVVIERREELSFLSAQLGLMAGGDEFFIAFSDSKKPGLYQWLDGTPITFTNWGKGQPDDSKGQCVTMSSGYNAGYWADRMCGDKYRYVCEKARSGYPPITAPTAPPPTTPTDMDCANGWVGYGTRCFQLFEFTSGGDAVGWDEANRVCRNFGGDLASFHHPDEEKYLNSKLKPTTSGSFWIGLNDQRIEGGYKWSDGTQVEYTKWGAGEPNDYGGEEECVETNMKGGNWNDLFCWYKRNFVCSIARGRTVVTTPVPTPPTGASCPNDDDFTYLKPYCYFFSVGWWDWYSSENLCHDKGAHLASIHGKDEQDFVKNRMKFGDYWIGLRSNLTHPGSYKWSDSSYLDYEYWLKGQPDTLNGEQLCVKMSGDPTTVGRWADENCGTLARFVCKKPLDDIPVVTHAPTQAPSGGCMDGWIKYNDNRCYKILGSGSDRDPKMNWQDAKKECKVLGAHLASIHTSDVQNYLTADMLLYANGDVWIGMSALTANFYFLWSDSSSNDYYNWGYSEPNYYFENENSTDCVRMKYDSDDPGKWNDEDCSAKHGYLCKMFPDDSNPDTPVTSPCPDAPSVGYTKYGDVCFKVDISTKRTYSEAKAFCENEKTVLASVLSGFEQAKLRTMTMEANDDFWIGLYDNPSTGIYSWLDGWPLYYTNWGWNDPKGLACTTMGGKGEWWNFPGEWSSVDCSEKHYTACKYSSGTPPTPRPTSEGYCEEGWSASGSSCYIMGTGQWDTATFKEAVYDCDRYYGGAHVATIGSIYENAFVKNLALKDLGVNWVLIGLERAPSGAWEWMDASPLYFVNWGEDEPSGYGDCAEIRPDAQGKWYDIGCDVNSHFVCEKPKISYITTAAPFRPKACPDGADDGWVWLNSYCYNANNLYKSFHDAEVWCNKNGGYLASIHSDEEFNFVSQLASTSFSPNTWIGFNKLYDQNTGDDYRWTDGSIPDYTAWAIGQPNDKLDAQKCVRIRYNGKWEDANCGSTQKFICKRQDDNTSPIVKLPPPPPSGNCPQGWSKINSGCYQLKASTADYTNWTDARLRCKVSGSRGDLASIHDQGTQSLLANMLKKETGNVWIGLAEGTAGWFGFHWVDQSNVDYEHWARNQPSFNFNREACVVMVNDINYPGRWDDIECIENHGYLCYLPLNPDLPTVPPPSSSTGGCPLPDYQAHDKDCFKMNTTRMTFDDAKKSCEAEGAALATIIDGYTEAFVIAKMMYPNKNSAGDAWIGLKADNSTGRYVWVDQWPVTYTNWASYEPSGGDELCVKITQGAVWKTDRCEETRASICRTTTGTFVPPTQPYQGAGCPDKWTAYQNRCYNFDGVNSNTIYVSWHEATYLCQQIDPKARVLSIHSQAENDYLQQMTQSKNTYTGIWLDLTLNETSTGQFEYLWNDGHALDYTNWNLGEPSPGLFDRDCTMMMPSAYGKWKTSGCSWGAGYACQMPQDAVKPESRTGLSGGVIAAIIVGVLLAVILVMVLGYFLLKNRQAKGLLDDQGLPPTTGFDNVLYTPSLEEVKTHEVKPDTKPDSMSDA